MAIQLTHDKQTLGIRLPAADRADAAPSDGFRTVPNDLSYLNNHTIKSIFFDNSPAKYYTYKNHVCQMYFLLKKSSRQYNLNPPLAK
jgi:hypothetical protein